MFIQDTVDDLLGKGIVRPNSSLWRAKVVSQETKQTVTRNSYASTIDKLSTFIRSWMLLLYYGYVTWQNELAKHKVFSTFDLISTYL